MNNNLTYLDLLEAIKAMAERDPDRLQDNVSIRHNDEFYELHGVRAVQETDVLEAGHLYLQTADESDYDDCP